MGVQVDLLKAVDAVVGRGLAALLSLWPGRKSSQEAAAANPPSRILVIRPGGIGDAVLFVPMLRALRAAWPEAELHLLLERRNRGVLQGTGLADRLHLYDRPGDLLGVVRESFDMVIDTEQFHYLAAVVGRLTGAPRRIGFATNGRRRLLTETVDYDETVYEVHSFLDLAAAATGSRAPWDPDAPFYPVTELARQRARERLEPLEGLRRVAIHPGASIPERRWPPERYAELALMLARNEIGIVVLGGPADGQAAAVIERALGDRPSVNLATRCSLAEAAAVVEQVDVYVSADSGVLHLAYGVGTPTVHLFGPGVLSKWGPQGKRFVTIRTDAPCSPCTRFGYTPPCNQGMVCMQRITAAEVARAVRAQLDAGPGKDGAGGTGE
jgi:lipopolysaccharide heptosyltransferase II